MRLRIVTLLAAALATAGCMGSGSAPSTTRGLAMTAPLSLSGSVSAMLNQQRAVAGLAPLSRNRQLDRIAMGHAQDQASHGYFGHTGSTGTNVYQRMRQAGYDACLSAENIAMGQQDEASVMADWMESAGHRSNILHPRAEQFGFARSGDHWVMVLARPC
jgi:uncharacterized protein YkwD